MNICVVTTPCRASKNKTIHYAYVLLDGKEINSFKRGSTTVQMAVLFARSFGIPVPVIFRYKDYPT